ncbi:MAG: response regulator transcription factor [Treponema sp.]|nr:response regulator transcription factor [Treponema sp.]
MIRIALIDDHPLAINGICAWLKGTGRFEIAGTAGTLAQAAALMKKLDPPPAVVILDISLEAEDGLEFIPALKQLCAKRKAVLPGILVCSMYEDSFLIQRAMNMGARAFVPKSAESGELLTAIDALLAGDTYVNPKYKLQKQHYQALTHRENEIVSLIKQSLSAKEIAKRLKISLRTVENHLTHIYAKTNTASREELFNL